MCHFLFAYAGPHQNLFQPYVAVITVLLMAFLLWLSVRIDSTSHPETLQCLRRLRQVSYSGPLARAPLRLDRSERMVALIGDSLSTSFCVGSLPQMIIRSWRAWKTNWFIGLVGDEADQSVVIRLSAYGPISATQHSSVAAMVDVGQRRSIVNHLMGTYNFRDQVDEVLSGSFPSIVLLWIGHNDVDWMSKTDSLAPRTMSIISDAFVDAYEIQLRRLLDGAIAGGSASAIVVFGLVNFRTFFDARAEAEALQSNDDSLYPYLKAGYKSFVSMKPQHRAGMIELAVHFNQKLEAMCNRLAAQLADTKVRLVYSNAMSLSPIRSAADLSPIDAWHPSLDGHRKLATCAYPAVHEQAQFLGWTKGILTVE